MEGKNQTERDQVCPYCFQFLLPGNCRVRLRPKMKITPRVQKLLNVEAKNHRLNLKQTKILRRYKESKNVLVITCNLCKKTTRHYGKSRTCSVLKTPTLQTPTFSDQRTRFSLSHSGSKRRKQSSRSRTPTSGQSTTPRSGSGTPKNSKSQFSRLKRLLSLEDNKKNDKGDLKNFLLSL